jgi:uncharacterized protein (AIM24 family)
MCPTSDPLAPQAEKIARLPLQGGRIESLPADADEPFLVGSLFWRLQRGDQWILGPESAFLFKDCWRSMLAREAYMLEKDSTRGEVWKDALRTIGRRWITGEPFLLDLYVAERDGAELAISSDELGGNLYSTYLERGPLICRKTVYFGSQKDVMLRVTSPLSKLATDGDLRSRIGTLKGAIYGPGWIFQKFVAREGGDQLEIILQVDGDVFIRELKAGETLKTDPRHTYAWDDTVSYRLVKFGSIGDRLLRGSVPFQVEFEGPGRVWLSNMKFADGYLGEIFTPSHWVFRIQRALRRLISYLNPFNWA